MKNLAYLLIFIVLSGGVFFYLYQKGNPFDVLLLPSQLPQKRPVNMVIEVGHGGGMLPVSKGLYISKDSCYQKRRAYQVKNKTYFKLTPQELDQLYQVFVANKFDCIKTYHTQTHDRGGTSVYLRINRKTYQVHNSGNTYIKKSSQSRFSKVVTTIKAMAATKLHPLKQGFEIQLSPEITRLVEAGYISSHTADINKGFNKEDSITSKQPFQILPGNHRFQLSFNTKDTLANGKKYLGQYFQLVVDQSIKGIKVFMAPTQDSTKNISGLTFQYLR